MILFVDPELHALANARKITCNILTVISEGSTASGVAELACCRQMFGPSLGLGSELVVPNERRDSNGRDRKSTRLNSSHVEISYAVFCLKKKNSTTTH